MYIYIYIESWPEWDLNPRPQNSVQNLKKLYVNRLKTLLRVKLQPEVLAFGAFAKFLQLSKESE